MAATKKPAPKNSGFTPGVKGVNPFAKKAEKTCPKCGKPMSKCKC